MLDCLTGTRHPAPGVRAASPDAVRGALLAVARQTAPFVVRPGTSNERGADLVAEWRLADPAWYAVFAPARTKQLRILMRFVPERREVRAIDRMSDLRWTAGRPIIEVRALSGQVSEASFDVPPFIETTAQGRRIRFHLATAELKDPLRDAVTAHGWTWRGALVSL